VPNPDLIVVGAGAAGLAAAAACGEAGLHVVVLEARDRVGGRIHTLHYPDFPLPIELGAEFVHGRPEETVALIERAGLAEYEVADRHLRRTGRGLEEADDFWSEISRVLDRLDAQAPDRTFAEFLLHDAGDAGLADARRLAARYVEGFHAADLAQISARAVAQAEGGSASGGGDASRILNGYAAVVGELHHDAVRTGAEVRLGHEVTALHWHRGSVRVTTRDGDGESAEWSAQRAIVTLPLPLLQDAAGGGGGISIQPFPVGWTEALGGLRMGHVVRTVIRFRSRFWPRHASFVHHPDGERWQLWWSTAPIDAPVLTGWCGGPPAERLARLAPGAIAGHAVADLAQLFGEPPARIADLVVGADTHDWTADRFARGAYSYVAAGGTGAAERLAEPVENTLAAAGEAAAPSGRHGTVDGAIASGRRAAARLLGGR
jgi:monoamine oxidase